MREIGCSNFSQAQIQEAEKVSADSGWARFVSVQNEYSLLKRDPENDGVLAECAAHRMSLFCRSFRSPAVC